MDKSEVVDHSPTSLLPTSHWEIGIKFIWLSTYPQPLLLLLQMPVHTPFQDLQPVSHNQNTDPQWQTANKYNAIFSVLQLPK